ncbi:tectonic-1 [Pyxicephalus adspersus]|uniref:tectonic-1 n=1 Tax=Pyxicephalus adspersus TaxID=30357 RepID=UPI003B59239A
MFSVQVLLIVLCLLQSGCSDISGTQQPNSGHNASRSNADNETEVWELLENDTQRATERASTTELYTEASTLTQPVSPPLSSATLPLSPATPPLSKTPMQPACCVPCPPDKAHGLASYSRDADAGQASPSDTNAGRALLEDSVGTSLVSSLCVCDLLVAQCDVNCCCDPDCTNAEFSVFSGCSVSAVTGDRQLCMQEAILYSINTSTNIPQRVTETVQLVNPNVFCVQTTNYQPALSFITPNEPTEANFDSLLAEFGGNYFNKNSNPLSNSVISAEVRNLSRYEYGVPILTQDSYLKLPAPLGTEECVDSNPIDFVPFVIYINVIAFFQVNVTVQAITIQSNGALVRGNFSDKTPSYNSTTGMCTNVVLGGQYSIMYTAQGEITNVLASFTLGAIGRSSFRQSFEISFKEEGTTPVALSGNPGYVFGMPVIAGFKLPQSGIVQSTNRFGQLTLLKSSTDQSCLTEEGKRATVLFGYNMMSGCKLHLNSLNYTVAAFCQLAEVSILNALKGQQFPEYVAQFGNSQPENVLDWVVINTVSPGEQASAQTGMCKIPVSLELEIRWTKFGSLVNPQAQIVNVTQKISYAFIPDNLGSGRTVQISSAVTFVDVSQAASAGYKAQPTIDAKLPFDFFHPFV